MKTYLTHFIVLSLICLSTLSASAQKDAKESEQTEYVTKIRQTADSQIQILTTEDVSKKQTKHLQELLNFDDKQTSSVYDICFTIEKKIREISTTDYDGRMAEINALEQAKDEKLKEIFTKEQFTMYIKSVKNDNK